MNEIAIVIISSKIADDLTIICTICLVWFIGILLDMLGGEMTLKLNSFLLSNNFLLNILLLIEISISKTVALVLDRAVYFNSSAYG